MGTWTRSRQLYHQQELHSWTSVRQTDVNRVFDVPRHRLDRSGNHIRDGTSRVKSEINVVSFRRGKRSLKVSILILLGPSMLWEELRAHEWQRPLLSPRNSLCKPASMCGVVRVWAMADSNVLWFNALPVEQRHWYE